MRKILITGGAGFLASSLADKLLESDQNQLVLVDNLVTGDLRKVPSHPKCKFIKCDVNEYNGIASIMTSFHFDYVFHYAAMVGVKRTLENPVMVLRDIDGIKNILELCKNTGVKRVFYSSSSEVYGEPVVLPQNEDTTPLNSRLPYAIVKNVGEAFCRSYYKEFGLEYTIFRFFNTYGPKQSSDFVISKFIRAALKGSPIFIYGDGRQTRTFCFVEDNVSSIAKILEQSLFMNDVINIGNDAEVTLIDLAKQIISLTKSTSEIQFLPPLLEGDMTRRQPDIAKMKTLYDKNLTSIELGVELVKESRIFKVLNDLG
jgi:nucleoside-diphosphate-sugar epimerase